MVSAVYFAVAYWLAFLATDYRGSWPVYFETGIWPYAVLFCAIAIAEAVQLALKLLGSALRIFGNWLGQGQTATKSSAGCAGAPLVPAAAGVDWLRQRTPVLVLLGAVVGVIVPNIAAAMSKSSGTQCIPDFSPVRATEITEALRKTVALQAGEPFRGLVARIGPVKPGSPGDWMEFVFENDRALWRETGNDHRTVGLWSFN